MPTTLIVLSHPNHEAAILGTIQRLQPTIVFLTDGGSEARVEQTRRGLKDYLPAGNMHFLNHREQALYDALLRTDAAFYRDLAHEVRDIARQVKPGIAYCDAVEFYNPIHDMALPVTRVAMQGHDMPIMEIPLIYQKASTGESFEMQRVPPSLESQCAWTDLTKEEWARKVATLKGGDYSALFEQLGDAILAAVHSHAGREQFLRGRLSLPTPAPEQVLRYDRRGAIQKTAGAISEAITYAKHYAPLFRDLCRE